MPQLHQSRPLAQGQHLQEQVGQRLQMVLAKVGDGAKIRGVVGRQYPKGDVLMETPGDTPGGGHPGAVAVEVEEKVARAVPRPKEQSNFTDPDSRIMTSSHGWIQGYNAQVLVEEGSGVKVAQEATAQSSASPRLGPVLDRLDENLAGLGVPEAERRPRWFTADAGYRSERSLGILAGKQIDAYVATGTGETPPKTPTGWGRSAGPDQDAAALRHAVQAADPGRAGDLMPGVKPSPSRCTD